MSTAIPSLRRPHHPWPFPAADVHLPQLHQLSADGMPVPSRQEIEFADGRRIWLRRVSDGDHPSEWMRELGEPAEGALVDLRRCVSESPALVLRGPGVSAGDVARWLAKQLRARFATRDAFLEFAVRSGCRE